MSALSLYRTSSLSTVELKLHPQKRQYGGPLGLDRYLTHEGHKLVAEILRCTEIQNTILRCELHRLQPKDIDDLIKSYKSTPNRSLETLKFEQLSVSSLEIKLLCKLIRADTITNIRSLILTKNHLNGPPIKELFDALGQNSTITKLDLSYNALGDREAKWLGKLLKKNKSLREVYLTSNKITEEGAKHLAKALRDNIFLERLSLDSNALKVQGGVAIGDMLKTNRSLSYLHLGSNVLGSAGIRAISNALKTNKTLISLSLDVNSIGVEGSQIIGEMIKVNKTLTHLYLPRNNIGDEGLKHICDALKENNAIIYIDLEFNGIGNEGNTVGAKSLATLLGNSIRPRAINLKLNPLGDNGCKELAAGFYNNVTLESIILSHCNIGLDGITAISESLKVNQGLQNINLHSNNAIGADGHLMLAEALEENTTLKGIQLDYNFQEWERVGNLIQVSLTRNHFLQQEKYATACRMLKTARMMLNSSPAQSSSPTLRGFLDMPLEIRQHILFKLDTNDVISESEKLCILNFATRKATLGRSMESFLSTVFNAYYPLTSAVQLWPTDSSDNQALTDRY